MSRSPTKRNRFGRNVCKGGRHTDLFIKERKFSSSKSGGPGGAAPWSKNLNHFLAQHLKKCCLNSPTRLLGSGAEGEEKEEEEEEGRGKGKAARLDRHGLSPLFPDSPPCRDAWNRPAYFLGLGSVGWATYFGLGPGLSPLSQTQGKQKIKVIM